jgi:hypothetical protein
VDPRAAYREVSLVSAEIYRILCVISIQAYKYVRTRAVSLSRAHCRAQKKMESRAIQFARS